MSGGSESPGGYSGMAVGNRMRKGLSFACAGTPDVAQKHTNGKCMSKKRLVGLKLRCSWRHGEIGVYSHLLALETLWWRCKLVSGCTQSDPHTLGNWNCPRRKTGCAVTRRP